MSAPARGPNFFLVGAAKSGTTTLYTALREHPDVYLPAVKESHVYAHLADPSTAPHLYPTEAAARRRYHELYADVDHQSAVGDASTTNLVVPRTAELIAREVPSARVVAILRQPVDRAFSHHSHFVAAGGEDVTDFAQAVRNEDARQAAGLPFTYRYLGWSRYSEQLRPFLRHFGRDRVLVHLYDDLLDDPEAVVRATFSFLGVDDTGTLAPVARHNSLEQLGASQRARLEPAVRAELTEHFADEITRLEDLLDRDLSAWR